MLEQTLAAADTGEAIGYVAALLLLPALGILLLVLGIRRAGTDTPPPAPPPDGQRPDSPGDPLRAGTPGHPAYWPPSSPPAKKPGAIALIVIGGVLMVLGLGGAGLAALGASAESTPTLAQTSSAPRSSAPATTSGLQVGECITNSQYSSANMSPPPTDCDLPDAVYGLAHEGSGATATCPDGEREESGYAVLLNNSRILCFALNVAEGECFEVDQDAQLFKPLDCTDPAANSKVDTIIEGASDLSRCPGGARGAAFPEPSRTYCFVSP